MATIAKSKKPAASVKSSVRAPKSRKRPPQGSTSADWRAEAIDEVRGLILAADPGIVEEVKWRKPSNAMQGVPVWSRNGIICTGETYKDKVKFTFMHGAALDDPAGLFNAGDGGATRRAIDLREGEMVDAQAFKALVKAAVALNGPAKPATSKGRR